MKKVFILLSIMYCSYVSAQTDNLKVSLKNGVIIIGEMKEFDPTNHVTLMVSGIETKIPMSNVASVESIKEGSNTAIVNSNPSVRSSNEAGYYEITDKDAYPENFTISVFGKDVKMILIRGGSFNMGYNGKGSISMNSEPIHHVKLSSYYISEQPVSYELASKILNIKDLSKKHPYYYCLWKDANLLIGKIIRATSMPCRMITEAEWEYAALMPNADALFGRFEACEWCHDYFGDYEKTFQINPKGPAIGVTHVYRSYLLGKTKWDRNLKKNGRYAYVRIAISADNINDKLLQQDGK